MSSLSEHANDDGHSDVLDRWVQIGDSDDIWGPPRPVDLPLVATGPIELDVLRIGWENFEKLIWRLVTKLEHTNNVHIYGIRRQRQDGIDVVCLPVEGEPSVYQAKRRAAFGAHDLREAIQKYADDQRPIRANRFIVVAACDAHDTATIQALQEGQDRYPDLKIEFWDRSALSGILVGHPDLVEQFFGEATRRVFCVGQAATRSVTAETLSDFVQRGPIRHLGLGPVLSRAEVDEAERPSDAAESYAQIAQALAEASFTAYAKEFRLRQADVLKKSGELVAACRLRLEVAWSLLDSAELWTARVAVRTVAQSEEQLPESMVRSLRALEWIIGRRLDAGPELDDVAVTVDALEVDDPYRHLGLLALAEEALAALQLSVVEQRVDAIRTIIDDRSLDDAAPLVTARLRCCIADATGDWADLMAHARIHYPSEVAALVSARWGRFAALHGNVDLAVERYQDAIRSATDAGNYGDAWAWLYALRSACFNNDQRVPEGIGDIYLTAETVRSLGDKSVVPHGRTRTQAAAKLNVGKPIEAYEAIVRHIRHSTMTASLSEEPEAHAMLGQLLARTGRLEGAIGHYINAGDAKAAAGLADHWPNQVFALDADTAGLPLWQRAAAFATVTAFDDWMEDEGRAAWASNALREILADPGITGKLMGRTSQAAYETLAVTALAMSADDAKEFVEHTETLCESGQQCHYDAERHSVSALCEIARNHSKLAERVVTVIMRLLLQSSHRASIGWADGHDILQRHQGIVREHLSAKAQVGDQTACIVMAVAGCADEPVIAQAKRCLERTVSSPERQPGVRHIGTRLHEDAYLVGLLNAEGIHRFVTAMMALTVDPEELLPNRQQALDAARVCMPELTESQRSSFFETATECASGLHDSQGSNPVPVGATDPLSLNPPLW